MLFGGSAGSAFQNVGRFFLYRPDSAIRSAAYFDTNKGLVKEYEYQFTTNNLGLVQKADVETGKPSALVLGDSFTQGQGAEPWFEQVAPFFAASNLQPINGGLLASGFRQWMLLHEHLKSRDIVIKKLVVVLISDDYERPVWNFPPHVLECLSNYLACVGDEEFYGMPPDSGRQAFLEMLRNYKDPLVSRARLRGLLPATTLAYGQARRLAGAAMADDARDSRQIRFFTDRYGENMIFVHLPELEELRDGLDETGLAVREAIRQSGARLFDGFKHCGLTVEDFYVHDHHPNAAGYVKIADCVREAAKEIM